jgi:hypothetical protein
MARLAPERPVDAPKGVISATIPGVPSYNLSPNARVSHWTKSKLVKEWRGQIKMHLRAAWGPEPPAVPDGPLDLHVEIAWPRGRRNLDDDNATSICKFARDQLCASLGLPSDARVRTASVTQGRALPGDLAGSVTLVLEPANAPTP